jgi:diguanylate cyclase (GGDEF)-like protein
MVLELNDQDMPQASAGAGQNRAAALLVVARTLGAAGNSSRAAELATEALALARGAGDQAQIAEAAEVAAAAHLAASAYPQALALYLEALALWQQLNVRSAQIQCLSGIAHVDLEIGDYGASLSRLEEALALIHEDPEARAEATIHFALGKVYMRLGELSRAREFHELALARRRELGDDGGVAASLNSLGIVRLRTGEQSKSTDLDSATADFGLARELFEEAESLAAKVGDVHLQALALGNIGSAIAFTGDLERAMPLFRRQLDAVRTMHDRQNEGLCLTNIGEAHRLAGRYEDAVDVLEQALTIGAELRSQVRVMRAHLELSRCREAQGDMGAALAHFKEYHRLEQALRTEEAEEKAHKLIVQMAVRKVREEAETYRAERDKLAAANVELIEAVHVDVLTGLANRRYLDLHLPALFDQMRAEGRSLGIALADIDHFKGINDRYSHTVGDQVLRTVGKILRAACRPSDMAARYGGEEFVLMLPDTPLAHARAACQRLRAAVAGYPWGEINAGLKVTVSIGVTDDQGQANAIEMLSSADRQLYEAKRSGRNCVR